MITLVLFYLSVALSTKDPLNIKLPSQVKLLEEVRKHSANRRLSSVSNNWSPIRVHYEYLEEPLASVKEQTETALQIIQTFFGKHLLVKRQTGDLQWLSTYETDWYYFTVPQSLQRNYTADLVFFVAQETDSTADYIARCAPVIFDETTGRPIFGLMIINNFYFAENIDTNAQFEAAVQIIIHESIHGLGFTQELFPNYFDSATGLNYTQTVFQRVNQELDLPTPRLKQLVENHFGCSIVAGAAMEDQGGQGTVGSHFERSLFYNELMTGTEISGNALFTEFTFTLLEDTGFYHVISHNKDVQIFGKDKGCDFLTNQCFSTETYPEFCNNPWDTVSDLQPENLGCSYAHTGVGICVNDGYVECPYYYVYPKLDCRDASNTDPISYAETNFYFGHDSMCVEGGLPTSKFANYHGYSCFQYSCDSDNKLTIIADGVKYDCSEGGSKPSYDNNKYLDGFTCPNNPSLLCETKSECPNQCNKKGYCLGGVCNCMKGYSGLACDKSCSTYRSGTDCVATCPTGTFSDDYTMYCLGCPSNCQTCTAIDICTECADHFNLRGGFCDPAYSWIMSLCLIVFLLS